MYDVKLNKDETKRINVYNWKDRWETKVKDVDYWKTEFEIAINEQISSNEVKMQKKLNDYDTALEYYQKENLDELKRWTAHFVRLTVLDKMTWLRDNDPPLWADVVQSVRNLFIASGLFEFHFGLTAIDKAVRIVAITIQEVNYLTYMDHLSEEYFKSLPNKLVDVLNDEGSFEGSRSFMQEDLEKLLTNEESPL